MKDMFAFIDAAEELAVLLETELTSRIAISPDATGEGELEKCEFLASWLKNQGITQLERFDAPDPRAKGGVRPNLIATIPGKQDGEEDSRLWIMSHLDVVPPGNLKLWKSDPFRVIRKDDGPLGARLIGRGVEDNQQGMVASIIAALALQNAGITPERTVKLLFVADEENGSAYGIDWLLKNKRELFRKQDMALIPDGGDTEGASIEIAEKNLLWLKLKIKGVQTHGSRPDLGANACLAASDLAIRLRRGLREKFSGRDPLYEPDYSTFEPTKREANVPNINTIPGEDVFYMDMRILPQYPLSEALAEIDRLAGEVEKDYGVTVATEIIQRVESKPTSRDSPLVAMLSQAVKEVFNVETRPIGIGGGTVGAFLRNQDIDSVVWSRLGDSAHQPNEYALIRDILGEAKVMALLMTETFSKLG